MATDQDIINCIAAYREWERTGRRPMPVGGQQPVDDFVTSIGHNIDTKGLAAATMLALEAIVTMTEAH